MIALDAGEVDLAVAPLVPGDVGDPSGLLSLAQHPGSSVQETGSTPIRTRQESGLEEAHSTARLTSNGRR